MGVHCFESDPCELLARVHDRHPVWTRLELAEGARMTSGSGVTREQAMLYRAATTGKTELREDSHLVSLGAF